MDGGAGSVDPTRSWFAVLAPFTRRDDRPAQVTTAPAGWREIDVPDKDLVPAAAALMNPLDRSGCRWWSNPSTPLSRVVTIDGRPVEAEPVQVFLGPTGAGVVVVPLRPTVDADDPESWVQLARRATRVGREHVRHGHQASKGVTMTLEDQLETPRPLRDLLLGVATSAGAEDVEFDDRAIAYTSLFLESNQEDAGTSSTLIARHLLRRVSMTDVLRTTVEADDSAMLCDQAGTRMFASLRSAGFVGADLPTSDPYYATTLPQELRSQYLFALLLVLVYRTALLDLAARVTRAWYDDPAERHRRLNHLRHQQVELTAGGVFTQLMESTSQDHWHQMLIALFRMTDYNAEIAANLASLHDAVVAEATARLDRRVTALGVLVGIPSLILGFFGLSIAGVTSPGGISVGAAILVIVLAIGLAALSWWLLTTRSRPGRATTRRPVAGSAQPQERRTP